MKVVIVLLIFCVFQTIAEYEKQDTAASEISAAKESDAVSDDGVIRAGASEEIVPVAVVKDAVDSETESKSADQSEETRAERSTDSGLNLDLTAEFKTAEDVIGFEESEAKFAEDSEEVASKSSSLDKSEEKKADDDSSERKADDSGSSADLEVEKSASPDSETAEVTDEQEIRSAIEDLQKAVDMPDQSIDTSLATRRMNHPHLLDLKARTGTSEELDSQVKSAESGSGIRVGFDFGSHRPLITDRLLPQLNPMNRLIYKPVNPPLYNFQNQMKPLPLQKLAVPDRSIFDPSRNFYNHGPKFLTDASRERGNAYPYQPSTSTVHPFPSFPATHGYPDRYDQIFGKLSKATEHPLFSPGFQHYPNNVGLLNKPQYGLQGFSVYNK